ncbi:hypothetical protein F5X98DRAFT_117200 [Xylaria grammica]|nr:hypothetical protein F5X98DRAFT_117200 [Xylaria grammica]
MADVFSLTVSAISATYKTSAVIYGFLSGCSEARADLAGIAQQLSSLTSILELIKEGNNAASESVPKDLRTQLKTMLRSCEKLVKDIEKVIETCKGRTGAVRWTLWEKEKVKAMSVSLEAFKGGLSLALTTANLSITKDIKSDTTGIKLGMKLGMEEILQEIQRLRMQLPNDQPLDERRAEVENWLDNLTHYAETVVDDETIDEDDTGKPNLTDNRENAEDRMTRRSSIDSLSIHTPQEGISTNDDEIASTSPATPENLNADSSSQLIVSFPYSSKIISMDGNAERQICVTLDIDGLVRIWSMKTKELMKEHTTGRRQTSVSICPSNPEIVTFQTSYSEGVGRIPVIAAWNWAEDRKIHIPNEQFPSPNIYYFLPSSPVVFTWNRQGELRMIHLDAPIKGSSTVHKVLLSQLGISTNHRAASDRGTLEKVRFISDTEIVLLWRRPILKSLVRRGGKSDWFIEVADLSSAAPNEGHEKVLASKRYSLSMIKQARIISKFWLPAEVQPARLSTFTEKRVAIIFAVLKSGFRRNRTAYVMQLDTGKMLFTYEYPPNWWLIKGDSTMIFHGREGKRHAISLEDGREIAAFDVVGTILISASGPFVSARQINSRIEFWETPKPRALE